jgi:hypothetical protein
MRAAVLEAIGDDAAEPIAGLKKPDGPQADAPSPWGMPDPATLPD